MTFPPPPEFDLNVYVSSPTASHPQTRDQREEKENLDPALSSMRTSAGQQPQQQPQTQTIPNLQIDGMEIPDLSFSDNTLAGVPNSGSGLEGDGMVDVTMGEHMNGDHSPHVDSGAGLAIPTPKMQPFSRSPELRISHKIAERKRRKEMKDLFDELAGTLIEQGSSKASKWEVLSKSIDSINTLKRENAELKLQNESLIRELQELRSGQAGDRSQDQINATFTGWPIRTGSNSAEEVNEGGFAATAAALSAANADALGQVQQAISEREEEEAANTQD